MITGNTCYVNPAVAETDWIHPFPYILYIAQLLTFAKLQRMERINEAANEKNDVDGVGGLTAPANVTLQG